jgi:hypothetical protein
MPLTSPIPHRFSNGPARGARRRRPSRRAEDSSPVRRTRPARRAEDSSPVRRTRRARRAEDSSPVRQHWEKDGPAAAPERGGRTDLLTPRSGAGKRRPPATHGSAPWATVFRPSGCARCGAGNPACSRPHVPGKFRVDGAADPLVRAGPPGPAPGCQNQLLGAGVWPARGPAADGGVRPTIYADSRQPVRKVGCGQIGPRHK